MWRLLALCALLLPCAAVAAEDDSSLALSPRLAVLSVKRARAADLTGTGGGLIADYQRGLNDTLWLRAGAGGAVGSLDGQATFTALASVGLTYAVDVLKYVPYIGIGGGALVVGGGAIDAHVEPYLELGLGIDVVQSIRFSWGIDARFSSFVGDATVFLIGPRFAWHWGYF